MVALVAILAGLAAAVLVVMVMSRRCASLADFGAMGWRVAESHSSGEMQHRCASYAAELEHTATRYREIAR